MRRALLIPLVVLAPLLIWRHDAAKLLISDTPASRPARHHAASRSSADVSASPIIGHGIARTRFTRRLSAEVAGRIIDLPGGLRRGDTVRKDQKLIVIDDTEYQQKWIQAGAALEAEKVKLARLDTERDNCKEYIDLITKQIHDLRNLEEIVKGLNQKELASPREYVEKQLETRRAEIELVGHTSTMALLPAQRREIEANCRRLEAEVKLARDHIDECKIIAPCDGQIDELKVQLDERVQARDELLSIIDPVHIEVALELPLDVRQQVHERDAAIVTCESAPGAVWRGQVARLAARTTSAAKETFVAYIDVDNSAQSKVPRLIDGFPVSATILPSAQPHTASAPGEPTHVDQPLP